ncbi:MAG: 50S ribosomal protein L17 [bacterium]|nr:50S ribosomal protein L17 [bacterium]
MQHLRKNKRKLGKTVSHRKAMLCNMATSLFKHRTIKTTLAKSKFLIPLADHLITLAKRGNLHARRQVYKFIKEDEVVRNLFDNIAPNLKDRQGGYIQAIKSHYREGDKALVVIVKIIS